MCGRVGIGTLFTEEQSDLSKVTQTGNGKGIETTFLPAGQFSWLPGGLNTAQPLAKDVTHDSDLESWAFDLVVIGQTSQISLASIYTY